MTCYCTCRSDPTAQCPCHPVNIMLLDEPDEDTVEGCINKQVQIAMRTRCRGKNADVQRIANKLRIMWRQQMAEQPADAVAPS